MTVTRRGESVHSLRSTSCIPRFGYFLVGFVPSLRGAAVSSMLSLALASRRRGLAQTTLRLLTLLDPYPLDPQHLAARAEDLQGTAWLQASVAQAPRTMQCTWACGEI